MVTFEIPIVEAEPLDSLIDENTNLQNIIESSDKSNENDEEQMTSLLSSSEHSEYINYFL